VDAAEAPSLFSVYVFVYVIGRLVATVRSFIVVGSLMVPLPELREDA
jgi:hypothetical protein